MKRVRFADVQKDEGGGGDQGDVKDVSPLHAISHPLIKQDLKKKQKKLEAATRTVLPGEDDEDLDERGFQRSDQGPIKDVDPSLAAKRRAAARTEHRRRTAVLDVSIVPSDVLAAEEDYDEPEEAFLSGDIPVEPFHLRREREQGYFDSAGNYVEYRSRGEAKDAWLDALDDMQPQRVEGDLASRLIQEVRDQEKRRSNQQTTTTDSRNQRQRQRGRGRGEDDEEEDEGEDGDWDEGSEGAHEEDERHAFDPDDVLAYKQRIAGLLRQGEDVLSALRRLGAKPPDTQNTGPQAGKQIAQTPAALGLTAARQQARKLRRQQQEQQQQGPQQQGQGPQQQGQGQQGDGPGSGGSDVKDGGDVCMDGTGRQEPVGAGEGVALVDAHMNVGCVETEQQQQGVGGSGSGGQGEAAQGGSGGGGGGGARASKAKRNTGRIANADFDKLTEYADLLLSAGDFQIYNKTRERLMMDIARSTCTASTTTTTSTSTSTAPPTDAEVLAAQGGIAGQLAAALLRSAAVAAGEENGSGNNGEGGGGAGALPLASTPQGEDVDMFAEEEVPRGGGDRGQGGGTSVRRSDVHVGNGEGGGVEAGGSAASVVSKGMGTLVASAQPAATSGAQIDTSSVTAVGLEHVLRAGRASEGRGGKPVLDGVQGVQGASDVNVVVDADEGGPAWTDAALDQALAGFELDGSTGLHYNSTLGVWYNACNQLFMDANTGMWYRMTDEQQYEVVADAGKGLPDTE